MSISGLLGPSLRGVSRFGALDTIGARARASGGGGFSGAWDYVNSFGGLPEGASFTVCGVVLATIGTFVMRAFSVRFPAFIAFVVLLVMLPSAPATLILLRT